MGGRAGGGRDGDTGRTGAPGWGDRGEGGGAGGLGEDEGRGAGGNGENRKDGESQRQGIKKFWKHGSNLIHQLLTKR